MKVLANVRPAAPTDLDGLVESSTRLFVEDAGPRDPTRNVQWPRQHGAASFARELANPAHLTLVADADGTVVGHLSGAITEPNDMRLARTATLISMYVFDNYRNAGVGSKLVETFIQWARERQAQRLTVTAFAANTDAIRFYERNGFTAHELTLNQLL